VDGDDWYWRARPQPESLAADDSAASNIAGSSFAGGSAAIDTAGSSVAGGGAAIDTAGKIVASASGAQAVRTRSGAQPTRRDEDKAAQTYSPPPVMASPPVTWRPQLVVRTAPPRRLPAQDIAAIEASETHARAFTRSVGLGAGVIIVVVLCIVCARTIF
jgi:hypothetical protein